MRATLTRIVAIARKEFIHIRRDPRILIAVLDHPGHPAAAVRLRDQLRREERPDGRPRPGPDRGEPRVPRARTASSDFFTVEGRVDNLAAVDRAFDREHRPSRGRRRRPASAARSRAGEKATVAVLVDGTEPNSAQLGQAYAIALNAGATASRSSSTWADRQGVDLSASAGSSRGSAPGTTPRARRRTSSIPGLIVVIIMIVTVQQTAVTLVRERDQGTLEQMMVVAAPPAGADGRQGAAVGDPRASSTWSPSPLVGMLVFSVPLRGERCRSSRRRSVLFVLCCAWPRADHLGASRRALESANIIALLISFLPAFMLSGFVFPLELDPAGPAVGQLPLPRPLHDGRSRAGCSSRARASPCCGRRSLALARLRGRRSSSSPRVLYGRRAADERSSASACSSGRSSCSSGATRCCCRSSSSCRSCSSIMFGYVVGADVTQPVDRRRRPRPHRRLAAARRSRFRARGYFDIVGTPADERAAAAAARSRRRAGRARDPRGDRATRSRAARPRPIGIVVDGSDSKTRVGGERLRRADHRRRSTSERLAAQGIDAGAARASTPACACCSTRRSRR